MRVARLLAALLISLPPISDAHPIQTARIDSPSADSLTWVFTGLEGVLIRDVYCDPTGLVSVATSNGIFTSSDLGTTWLASGYQGSDVLQSDVLLVASAPPAHLYALTYTGAAALRHSSDGGATWPDASTNHYSSGGDLLVDSSGIVWANLGSGRDSDLECTTDRGRTWVHVMKDNYSYYPGQMAVGREGTVYASCTFWVYRLGIPPNQSTGILRVRSSSMSVGPSGELIVACLDTLYRSLDHGETWTRSVLGSGSEIITLETSPTGQVIAGCNQGIMISTNGGESWSLEPVTVPSPDWGTLSVSPTGVLFMAGTGGLFKAQLPNLPMYRVTATAIPDTAGLIIGRGLYPAGSTAIVRASANTRYRFSAWLKDGTAVSVTNPYAFPVTGDVTLSADFMFLPYRITTSVSPPSGGSVTPSVWCAAGDSATVVARANSGYRFAGWMEDGVRISLDTLFRIVVSRDRSLVATFVNRSFVSVTPLPLNGGSVTGGGWYYPGDTVVLVAVPSVGYRFAGWMEDGVRISLDTLFRIVVSRDRSLFATFVNLSFVSVIPLPLNGGSVTGGGWYSPGDTVVLLAVPSVGYRFHDWWEDGKIVSTTSRYEFSNSGPRTVTARFALDGIEGVETSPTQFRLLQNFPNPFNPSTTIFIHVPAVSFVRVSVIDLLGREIAVLVEGTLSAGVHVIRFSPSAERGAGIYFIRMTAPGFTQTRRVLLVR